MITYTMEVTFEPKLWILKWGLEKRRMQLAVWLIHAGLYVSGSEALLLLPQQVTRCPDSAAYKRDA